ncbi:hypothetical protein EMCG_03769 [[Emmonsia] crescens]|uniref:Uncharacterized protein n=1 Tax=[Emmonsia] crescens TaxID=73230 RepID=A0A0G2HVE7_9EURO|nr:hypothetical protein EMCG_03769 [Emmonsia crescens UAMH 3008]
MERSVFHKPVHYQSLIFYSIPRGSRSKHILQCRRQKMNAAPYQQQYKNGRRAHRAIRRPFLEFCYLCAKWYPDEADWTDHCVSHLSHLEPRCGPLVFRSTLVAPGFCPFCIGDVSKTLENRFRQWRTKATLINHIDDHLASKQHVEEIQCPHPCCAENITLYCFHSIVSRPPVQIISFLHILSIMTDSQRCQLKASSSPSPSVMADSQNNSQQTAPANAPQERSQKSWTIPMERVIMEGLQPPIKKALTLTTVTSKLKDGRRQLQLLIKYPAVRLSVEISVTTDGGSSSRFGGSGQSIRCRSLAGQGLRELQS